MCTYVGNTVSSESMNRKPQNVTITQSRTIDILFLVQLREKKSDLIHPVSCGWIYSYIWRIWTVAGLCETLLYAQHHPLHCICKRFISTSNFDSKIYISSHLNIKSSTYKTSIYNHKYPNRSHHDRPLNVSKYSTPPPRTQVSSLSRNLTSLPLTTFYIPFPSLLAPFHLQHWY